MTLKTSSDEVKMIDEITGDASKQKWNLISADVEDTYYIQNVLKTALWLNNEVN